MDKGTYHSKGESDRLLALFPKKWDTPISEVKEMGKEFILSNDGFWEKYGAGVF